MSSATTSCVASVEPSSTTSTRPLGSSTCSCSTTRGTRTRRLSASFRAGMTTQSIKVLLFGRQKCGTGARRRGGKGKSRPQGAATVPWPRRLRSPYAEHAGERRPGVPGRRGRRRRRRPGGLAVAGRGEQQQPAGVGAADLLGWRQGSAGARQSRGRSRAFGSGTTCPVCTPSRQGRPVRASAVSTTAWTVVSGAGPLLLLWSIPPATVCGKVPISFSLDPPMRVSV